ncbi:hypothetical protein FB451DRAFT_261242 [Mycena latifolia]|nr:hypothetical protein FB451DRAFT_261242 [Mycena latifolia]
MSSPLKTLNIVLLLLGLLGSAASQATTVPQCALGCARTAAIKAGCPSDLSNTPCLCQSSSFAGSVVQCVKTTSCSAAEQSAVGAILTSMCAAVSGSGSAASAPASGSRSISASASATAPSRPFDERLVHDGHLRRLLRLTAPHHDIHDRGHGRPPQLVVPLPRPATGATSPSSASASTSASTVEVERSARRPRHRRAPPPARRWRRAATLGWRAPRVR